MISNIRFKEWSLSLLFFGIGALAGWAVPVQVEVTGVQPNEEVTLSLTPAETKKSVWKTKKHNVTGGKGEVEIPEGIPYKVEISSKGYIGQTIHSIMFDKNNHKINAHLIRALTLKNDAFEIDDPSAQWARQVAIGYFHSEFNGDLDEGSSIGMEYRIQSPRLNPFRNRGLPGVPFLFFGMRYGEWETSRGLRDVDGYSFSIGMGKEKMLPQLKLGPWLPGITYGVKAVYTYLDSDGPERVPGLPAAAADGKRSDDQFGVGLTGGLVLEHENLAGLGFEFGGEYIKYTDDFELGSEGDDEAVGFRGEIRFKSGF